MLIQQALCVVFGNTADTLPHLPVISVLDHAIDWSFSHLASARRMVRARDAPCGTKWRCLLPIRGAL